MAVAKLTVERVPTLRVDDPGDLITEALERGIAAGREPVQVFNTFNEWLIVWKAPGREQRG